MIVRLLVGLLKGLVIGALVGYGLVAAGLTWGWLAYVAAAVTGMLVALVAGKPIWAKDARIEVGMKAAAGALLGPGLLWLVRSFVTVGLPIDPSILPGLENLAAEGLTLGTFSVTALAMVAAVLGGFYEADNQPGAGDDDKADKKKSAKEAPAPGANQRVDVDALVAAAQAQEIPGDESESDQPDASEQKRRR